MVAICIFADLQAQNSLSGDRGDSLSAGGNVSPTKLRSNIESASESLRQGPEDEADYITRAKSCEALGEWNNAITYYKKAAASSRSSADCSKIWCEIANAEMRLGDGEAALEGFDVALEKDPVNYEALVGRAIAESNQLKTTLALSDFTAAIAINHALPTPFIGRSLANLRLGNIELATRDVREAIRIDPKNGNNYVVYAKVLRAQGNYGASMLAIEEGLKRGANPIAAYRIRAMCYLMMGNYVSMRTDIDRALSLGVNDPDLYLLSGNGYRIAGEFFKALEAYRASWSRDPKGDSRAYVIIGINLLLRRLKKENDFGVLLNEIAATDGTWAGIVAKYLSGKMEAVEFLENAKVTNERNPNGHMGEAYYYIGEVVADTVGPDEAINYYRRCVSLAAADDFEGYFARSELKRLGVSAAQ